MDRRTFVLLTGIVNSGLIRPTVRRSDRPTIGRLRFELDDRRRWSLWYYGDGPPVPLVRDAEVLTGIGDRPLTLAELEDSTCGSRRPPGRPPLPGAGRTPPPPRRRRRRGARPSRRRLGRGRVPHRGRRGDSAGGCHSHGVPGP